MISFLRRKSRPISILFLVVFFVQGLVATPAFALTSGPTQPEVQSFQPAGATDMVDLFSGDFSYNIPLFELPGPNGGYPFNLGYQAGIGMDQEASWVGLGWNLQPGAITRQVRGLPDEFNGTDKITTTMSIRDNVTVGVGVGGGVEVFGSDNVTTSLGFSVRNNNYRGLGYSIDGSIGFSIASKSDRNTGVGLNLSLDSEEGVTVSPSLSLGNKNVNIGLAIGYNSKEGLSGVSFSQNFSSKQVLKNRKDTQESAKNGSSSYSVGGSSDISFAHPSYTPQITMPMNNSGISATLKVGGAAWGFFGSPYVTGFYNQQTLKNKGKEVSTGAVGYMNYQKADATMLLDVTREKDGIVSEQSPNLAIPSLSYDVYSVNGQGISAMYRPMRTDYGVVGDMEVTSESVGGSGGVDVGPGLAHAGVNLSVNHAKSTSGKWPTSENEMETSNTTKFGTWKAGQRKEPWYFKVHGESNLADVLTTDNARSDRAMRVKLEGQKAKPFFEGQGAITLAEKTDRAARNQVIQAFTNEQILAGGAVEILPQFKVENLDRSNHPKSHIGAITALSQDGMRYNYALPAYNWEQKEVVKSTKPADDNTINVEFDENAPFPIVVDKMTYDTEEYFRKVETPPYAYAHLLTSIVGPDYVDVANDGVSEDDLGYWVKFTYTSAYHKNKPYLWRDPYSGAHFQRGWMTNVEDNKASVMYGKKDMWYLAKAETRSHVAEFIANDEREDARGVSDDLNPTAAKSYKLKHIKLYSRLEYSDKKTPIKTVNFDYYDGVTEKDKVLCKGVYKNNPDIGKLTLKKLWFEYGASTKGKFNPYEFSYSNNESYTALNTDRWGNFKKPKSNVPNVDFPYVDQTLAKSVIDGNAAAWSLSEIRLPSGGNIKVDYETDDYAYVQHKQAMQMMEIVGPTNEISGQLNLDVSNRRVYFKLESEIADTPDVVQTKEITKYLDLTPGRNQIYFKALISLLKPSDKKNEYISGYATVDTDPNTMGLKSTKEGKFTHGYFTLKEEKNYHPFSVRAWQHLRTNQPELINPIKLSASDKLGTQIGLIRSIIGSFTFIKDQALKGFYRFCFDLNWGKQLALGQSWVRLKSPDKIKYGGGLRVKQITMSDNWQQDNEGVYGQVYDYTTLDADGNTISSGVAAYEPFVGGEENPLRYAKEYPNSRPLRSDNNLFFEYPINETYYPGAHVGYSKVAVMSLASASLAGKTPNGVAIFPDKTSGATFGTTGKTVHEFYTARDFPVLVDETEKNNQTSKTFVPIPFIGSISVSKLATSQGYSIVTNDMHGKAKKISTYRQTDTGEFEKEAISWVKYNYAAAPRQYERENVNSLENIFVEKKDQPNVLSLLDDKKKDDLSKEDRATYTFYTLGQETELFSDMRQYRDEAWTGGVRLNVDILFFVFFAVPAFVPWPSIAKSESQLRSAVTNKVIFKSGILTSTEAYDGGSLVKTTNEKWSKETGAVVLTSVNNNFDKEVFTYTIPAYTKHQGMGAAYRNTGFIFTAGKIRALPNQPNLYSFAALDAESQDILYPGDELVLYETLANERLSNPVARAIYTGYDTNDRLMYCNTTATLKNEYKAMVVRSGYRNQLTVAAGSISGLNDPSDPKNLKNTQTFNKTVTKPKL